MYRYLGRGQYEGNPSKSELIAARNAERVRRRHAGPLNEAEVPKRPSSPLLRVLDAPVPKVLKSVEKMGAADLRTVLQGELDGKSRKGVIRGIEALLAAQPLPPPPSA